MQVWYEKVVADSPKTKETLSESYSWVDVRDTALGHVLALEKDAAGGERIITTNGARHVNLIYPSDSYHIDIGGYNWQEWGMFTLSTSEYS
jgi:hypothetical protein